MFSNQNDTCVKTDVKNDGIEDPDKNPHSYSHLHFDKRCFLKITLEKTPAQQQMVLGK